jgi:hypothetical protein
LVVDLTDEYDYERIRESDDSTPFVRGAQYTMHAGKRLHDVDHDRIRTIAPYDMELMGCLEGIFTTTNGAAGNLLSSIVTTMHNLGYPWFTTADLNKLFIVWKAAVDVGQDGSLGDQLAINYKNAGGTVIYSHTIDNAGVVGNPGQGQMDTAAFPCHDDADVISLDDADYLAGTARWLISARFYWCSCPQTSADLATP